MDGVEDWHGCFEFPSLSGMPTDAASVSKTGDQAFRQCVTLSNQTQDNITKALDGCKL